MRIHIRLVMLIAMGFWLSSARAADARPQGPAAAANAHVAVLTADQVVRILDETVDWYRTLGTQQQTVTQPSDLLILYANRQTAGKVIALAFDIARANAELLSNEASHAKTAGDAASSSQALNSQKRRVAAQRQSM